MLPNADSDRLCIVLVGARNPLNIGAAARAMANFGFARLRVVHPYEAAFREARSAVGASAVLTAAEEYNTLADAIADCTLVVGTTAIGHRQPQHPLRTLQAGATLIRAEWMGDAWIRAECTGPGLSLESQPHADVTREIPTGMDLPDVSSRTPRVALVFGSEKVGLSNDDLSHCHWLLHIPTNAEQPSMNLGQAVAVCLYELAREAASLPLSAVTTPPSAPPATAEELERLTAVLLDTLHTAEYIPAQSAPSQQDAIHRAVRSLVRRMSLTSADASTWLGMLRQILWKLRIDC